MYWLFGTLVYLDAQLPRPGCRGECLGLPTGQGSLPSLKEGARGRRVSGRAGGEWEEGRKCKFLNGKKNKLTLACKFKKKVSWLYSKYEGYEWRWLSGQNAYAVKIWVLVPRATKEDRCGSEYL